jgi:FkbM family methyltransferase
VVEGNLVVSINHIPGSFEIDVRSHILQRILIEKYYEPEIVSAVKNSLRPEMDAINIGANIGIFSILIASLINEDCKVLAIEPTPLAFQILIKNIKRNNLIHKIELFNGICIDVEGEYTLNTIVGNEEYSSIGQSTFFSNIHKNIEKINVKGETVDNLVNINNLNPGFILMDVEGAEMKVLIGAESVIKNYHPTVILEVHDDIYNTQNTSSIDIISFFEKFNYDVYDINRSSQIKFPFRGNIIAIPKAFDHNK